MRRLAFAMLLLALAARLRRQGRNRGRTQIALRKRASPKTAPNSASASHSISFAMPTSSTARATSTEARAAVDDIVTYSEKARDAAMQTRKRLKNVEIDVRKMAEKLRDIKRTLAFDDQAPVEQAIRRLEDVRTTSAQGNVRQRTIRRRRNEAGLHGTGAGDSALGLGAVAGAATFALPLLAAPGASAAATRSIRWRSTNSATPCSTPTCA